jgi:hypothetical protein
MKRITEAQIRQVIKEELIGLLNEMSQEPVKTVKFSELKKAQEQVGKNYSSTTGTDLSQFKNILDDAMIPIVKTRIGYAAMIKTEPQMKPMEFVISTEVAKKLGINTNSVKSAQTGNATEPSQVGNIAGLPQNLRSLHGLQEAIRRLILKELRRR